MLSDSFSSTIFKYPVVLIVVFLTLFFIVGPVDAGLRRIPNFPLGWVGADMGYSSGPNFGGYRDFLNDYYHHRGSLQNLSDFGGRLVVNLGLKSFFSSHFAYGFFLTLGGYSTDQVFDHWSESDEYYQSFEEYRLKSAQIGFELTFTPVNTRTTRIVPYIAAGGLLSSGVLEVLYSEDGPMGRRAWSYRENTFNTGYRFGGGLVLPLSETVALNASSFYSNSKYKFNETLGSGGPIEIENQQWYAGIGLVYFYR